MRNCLLWEGWVVGATGVFCRSADMSAISVSDLGLPIMISGSVDKKTSRARIHVLK
jgi:hypothetical protein